MSASPPLRENPMVSSTSVATPAQKSLASKVVLFGVGVLTMCLLGYVLADYFSNSSETVSQVAQSTSTSAPTAVATSPAKSVSSAEASTSSTQLVTGGEKSRTDPPRTHDPAPSAPLPTPSRVPPGSDPSEPAPTAESGPKPPIPDPSEIALARPRKEKPPLIPIDTSKTSPSLQPAPTTPERTLVATPESAPAAFVLKRRTSESDEDLRRQLITTPEIGLDQQAAIVLYNPILAGLRSGQSLQALAPDTGPRFLVAVAAKVSKPERAIVQWRLGLDCVLSKEAAANLNDLSRTLRACLQASTSPGDVRPDADVARSILTTGNYPNGRTFRTPQKAEIKPADWRKKEAIPVLLQLLQHESTPIRTLMVDLIARIPGKEASVALAQRALFDLCPEIREQAVKALNARPRSEGRAILVAGFRYPWAPVAEHAAEAITTLGDQDAVPQLVDQLQAGNPQLPYMGDENGKPTLVVTELVKFNHLSNCMVCHAPSSSSEDLVRGRIPVPNEEPPPLYYAASTGMFVRADTTFVRQDFSVAQPVLNAGKWPGNQRFDYLVRTRPATRNERSHYEKEKDLAFARQSPQRDAVLYALRELTGKDLGTTFQGWKSDLKSGSVKLPDPP